MSRLDLLWQVWDHRDSTEGANMAKRYSAEFKFKVVTELLAGDKRSAQVAKAYGIHLNCVAVAQKSPWRNGEALARAPVWDSVACLPTLLA